MPQRTAISLFSTTKQSLYICAYGKISFITKMDSLIFLTLHVHLSWENSSAKARPLDIFGMLKNMKRFAIHYNGNGEEDDFL